MARIRSIKPEFCTSAKVAQISIAARLTFLLMLTEADDEGVLVESYKRLAGCLFPLDDDVTAAKVKRWVGECIEVDMIHAYEAEAGRYLHMAGFKKHQKVSHATPSRFPPCYCAKEPTDTPESFARNSGAAPETLRPDLGIDLGTDLGEGSRNLATAEPPREPLRKRHPDELFDELVAVCRITPSDLTSNERAKANTALKQLREVGATPDEIRRRAANYHRKFPDAELTPFGLANNWGQLASSKVSGTVAALGVLTKGGNE